MKLNIYDALKKYSKQKAKRFHMPGHKGKRNTLFSSVAKYDITELDFSDNLLSPYGIIKKSQEEISAILGSKQSYFVTDGSSIAIFSMIYAVKDLGNSLLIFKNSHKSVYNALNLFNIKGDILCGEDENGLPQILDLNSVEEYFINNKDSIGILVTYPDYYGQLIDLKELKKLTLKYEKLLLVDGAQGGHFNYLNENEIYAGKYADIWVDGVHKSMPALTQGAVLSLSNQNLRIGVEKGLNVFRTTSPSYLIMASIEYSVKYLSEKGKKSLNKISSQVKSLQKDEKFDCFYKGNQDPTRLVLDAFKLGVDGEKLSIHLKNKNIYYELFDGRYIVFLFSANTKVKEIKYLKKIILSYFKKNQSTVKESLNLKSVNSQCEINFSSKEKVLVDFEESIGKISAENIMVVPPCTPVILAGEVITKDKIYKLQISEGVILGLTDNKISVLKE